jgi:hypothetical protein
MEIQRLAVDIKQEALALSTSPWTIRRQFTDGKLKTVRLGRNVLHEPSELHGLVQEGREACRPSDSRWLGNHLLSTENHPRGARIRVTPKRSPVQNRSRDDR